MKQNRSAPTNAHKLARLIAWAQLMLAWIGMMLFSETAPQFSRRHMLQRYRHLTLQPLARLVGHLILIRAAHFAGDGTRAQRQLRNYAPAGFARRMRPRQLVRSSIGSVLRKALRHRDLGQHFAILVHALAHLDTHARALARRLRRGRSRLCPIVLTRP
ncbi:MAG: hypothetical protein H7124_12645, partial [Phycisphaerales bacterium]|nr:hypothetical protein [Hyphomonadaceae bacterium]